MTEPAKMTKDDERRFKALVVFVPELLARVEELEEALYSAEDFVDRVMGWNGGPDENEEALAAIRAALPQQEENHAYTFKVCRSATMSGHGKQVLSPGDLDELLDLIERLHGYSRWGTFDAERGEGEAWRWAESLLSRYGRADSTSSTSDGSPS